MNLKSTNPNSREEMQYLITQKRSKKHNRSENAYGDDSIIQPKSRQCKIKGKNSECFFKVIFQRKKGQGNNRKIEDGININRNIEISSKRSERFKKFQKILKGINSKIQVSLRENLNQSSLSERTFENSLPPIKLCSKPPHFASSPFSKKLSAEMSYNSRLNRRAQRKNYERNGIIPDKFDSFEQFDKLPYAQFSNPFDYDDVKNLEKNKRADIIKSVLRTEKEMRMHSSAERCPVILEEIKENGKADFIHNHTKRQGRSTLHKLIEEKRDFVSFCNNYAVKELTVLNKLKNISHNCDQNKEEETQKSEDSKILKTDSKQGISGGTLKEAMDLYNKKSINIWTSKRIFLEKHPKYNSPGRNLSNLSKSFTTTSSHNRNLFKKRLGTNGESLLNTHSHTQSNKAGNVLERKRENSENTDTRNEAQTKREEEEEDYCAEEYESEHPFINIAEERLDTPPVREILTPVFYNQNHNHNNNHNMNMNMNIEKPFHPPTHVQLRESAGNQNQPIPDSFPPLSNDNINTPKLQPSSPPTVSNVKIAMHSSEFVQLCPSINKHVHQKINLKNRNYIRLANKTHS